MPPASVRQTALTFVESKHLKGMVETDAVAREIRALLNGDIVAWEKKRATAQREYNQATNENDAGRALAALERARSDFPVLDGLPAERQRWLNTLWLTFAGRCPGCPPGGRPIRQQPRVHVGPGRSDARPKTV